MAFVPELNLGHGVGGPELCILDGGLGVSRPREGVLWRSFVIRIVSTLHFRPMGWNHTRCSSHVDSKDFGNREGRLGN